MGMLVIRCSSCGFVFYQSSRELRSIDMVLREWGYKCPVCMSPLSIKPVKAIVGNTTIDFTRKDEGGEGGQAQ